MTRVLMLVLLSVPSAYASISFTTVGVSENFSSFATSLDWTTNPIDALPFDGPSNAEVDVIKPSNGGIDMFLSGSATNPVLPGSVNSAIAASGVVTVGKTKQALWNTANENVQMRPTQVAGSGLMTTLRNDTGAGVGEISVGYDFVSNKVARGDGSFGNEQILGWQGYYRTELDSSWTRIFEFDGGTGAKLANINFSGEWAVSDELYFLWIDDNARSGVSAADDAPTVNETSPEDENTLDNFAVTFIAPSSIPEPTSAILALFALPLLLRRRRA